MSGELKRRAYDHIVAKLVTGELPPGSRLSNRALGVEIGVSAIPVREAISQLQSEGLVEVQAGAGAFVPEPSYEELLDIYDLREAVECHAIGKTGGVLDEDTLAELAEHLDAMAEVADQLRQVDLGQRAPHLLEQWRLLGRRFSRRHRLPRLVTGAR